jgi:NAD(P)-dependent dehydrogenase (short-subunit alcohol dehydrogenase family)
MSTTDKQDPRESDNQAPYPPQQQPFPGDESKMNPRPDYGLETYEGSKKLEDTVCLITGGDSGIGRAVALAFAREGADVAISYLSEEGDAKETAAAVNDAGQKVLLLQGDIRAEDHCNQLIQKVINEFGKLDILINNAAFQMARSSILEISTEEFDQTIKTNLYAMFWLCKAAIPHLTAGSSIINVASIQAYQPSAELVPYAATKGAIVNFTKGLSQQLLPKGIRVNCVAPGPVWTPLIVSTMTEEKIKNFGEHYPIGRTAQPAELAPSFVFLASKDARYISGEVLAVTGGKFTS